jgi:hypothetical protein
MLACVVIAYVELVLREEKFQKKKALIPFSLLLPELKCVFGAEAAGSAATTS